MDEAIRYYSNLMSAFTFAAFVVGTRLFRHAPVWCAMYTFAFVMYILVYSLDLGGMIWTVWQSYWTFKNRQAVARTTICVCFWIPIILYLRDPRLMIDLYRYIDRTPHKTSGERSSG